MSLPRVVIVLLSMVGMAATLLPWLWTETHGAVPGTVGPTGWASFALFVSILLAQLATIARPQFQRRAGLLTSFLAGGATLLAGTYWYKLNAAIAQFRAEGDLQPGSIGVGVYVSLGAALLTFVASFIQPKGELRGN